MSNFEEYKRGLMEQSGVQDVVEASWIEPRGNNKAKPLLISFPKELPYFLDMPGEMMRTKVYEYKQRPMMCKNCLEYGHGKQYCEKDQRCARCGDQYKKNDCNSEVVKCR